MVLFQKSIYLYTVLSLIIRLPSSCRRYPIFRTKEGRRQISGIDNIKHLTKDTILESDKNTRKHYTQKSQEVSSFPAGDHKKREWVWSGNTTITNCGQTHGAARKSHTTITRHQEDKLSKSTSSLIPIKMIAKLEGTLSNVQQNIEQLQNPTMGVAINNKSTTTEPPP